jgi:hypothetical protein
VRILLEVRAEAPSGKALMATAEIAEHPLDLTAFADIGMEVDQEYPAVVVPRPRAAVRGGLMLAMGHQPEFSFEPEDVSYLLRGSVPDDDGQKGRGLRPACPPSGERCLLRPGHRRSPELRGRSRWDCR